MWQETNQENLRYFEEQTRKRGLCREEGRYGQQDSQRYVSQDAQPSSQDARQYANQEVVMVGMKPVMMVLGMGDETGVSNPLPRIFSLVKDHRFVAGLVIGAVLCFFAMDASLSSMRNHNANLETENKMLSEQVETLKRGPSLEQDDEL